MTSWRPDISDRRGPCYRAIAEAITDAARSGELAPGTRLPTHRELAAALGVTIGTVTRAYRIAGDAGIVSGEVGRGTYVRRLAAERVRFDAGDTETRTNAINLAYNIPVRVGDVEQETLRAALDAVAQAPALDALVRSSVIVGDSRINRAGAAWLRQMGFDADAGRVIVCSGVQHAMIATLSAVMRPGDTLVCEALSYPGIRALANMLRLNLLPIAMDEGGLVPESFERACVEHGPRALYCVPTGHTPTAIVMSAQRRRRIAQIAREHNVLILEDDEETALLDPAPTPIAALSPEHTVFMCGTEVAIAPGLRVAFVLAPTALVHPIADAVRTTVWVVSPIMGEIAATIIERGWAERLVAARRAELAVRRSLAVRAADSDEIQFREGLHHTWVPLSERWRPDQFAETAAARGVLVQSPDPFIVAGAASPRAVRLTLGAEPDRDRLAHGFAIVAELLRSAPPA